MTILLYITAFIGGLVTLSLELAAARLLAPAFGTSELVWSAIIGLILLYLAAGYELGGKWADRSPHPATLYTIVLSAGIAIGMLLFLSRPVLHLATAGMSAWNLGLVAGPFVVVLILFAPPVTLLACISPFVIRLAMSDVRASGITAGRIYAISTLGSFLGTFLPNLLLIPLLGTRRTFLLLALLAALLGAVGLWHSDRRRFWYLSWVLPLLLILLLLPPGAIKPQAGLIHEEESTYNLIQVVENEAGVRYLLLNEGQGIHSIYAPHQTLTGGTWDYFLAAPYFNPPPHLPERVDNLLVIGSAAGTIPAQYTAIYGDLPIDGVEIDPAIVAVGRRYFNMHQPGLHVHITDGRSYLQQTKTRYDVVAVDAYRLPYIPWHLTTQEFFQEIKAHLTAEGVVAINVGHTPDDWRLVEALVATMSAVYPSTHVISVPNTFNAIVIATVQPTEPANLVDNLALIEDQRLRAAVQYAQGNLVQVVPGGTVFTDDQAPVELLTDALVLRHILGVTP
ncbi:MAG: fused MFS/spermidine synthase [Anaerolineae bacterium]|nr:fused MFS/spermidine synthase [Anaerolineae bacterium]